MFMRMALEHSKFKVSLDNLVRSCLKSNKDESKGLGLSSVVGHVSGMYEALNLIPRI